MKLSGLCFQGMLETRWLFQNLSTLTVLSRCPEKTSHAFHCFVPLQVLLPALPELPQLPYLEVITPYSGVFMIFPQLIAPYYSYLFMSLALSTWEVFPWGSKNVLFIPISLASFRFPDIRNALTRNECTTICNKSRKNV